MDEGRETGLALAPGYAEDPPHQVQKADGGHVGREDPGLRQEADPLPELGGVGPYGLAENVDSAGRRPVTPQDHPQQGGLAGAVRADKPEDAPLRDGEVHPVDGDEAVVEDFREVLGLNS